MKALLTCLAVCTSLNVAGAAAPLFTEDFSAQPETRWGELPPGWWLEGAAGGARARIHEGRLWVDAKSPTTPGATIWLERVFEGDVEVAFDVHVVAAHQNVNNMNFFFLFRDGAGASLRAGAAERDSGRYPAYHSGKLHGTILTFLANEGNPREARVRVRQVPPFDPVMREYTGYHAEAGRTYRVTLARRGARLTCEIDGRLLIDTPYPRPAEAAQPGLIGFRTWRTELWWDNIVVRRPAPSPAGSAP